MTEAKAPPLEPVEPSEGVDSILAPYTSTDAREDLQKSGEGSSTGFSWLDKQGFRFVPGKLYAVAARPSVGKTAFLLELLVRHAEMRAGLRDLPKDDDPIRQSRAPAVFVTYEETRAELYVRLLIRQVAADAEGPPYWWEENKPGRWWARTWLRGKLEVVKPELKKAADAVDRLIMGGHLVLVDGDRDGGDVDKLLASLSQAAGQWGGPPSLVVVDYYQKIRPPADTRAGSRQLQLQEVADKLRRYAKGELSEAEQEGAEWTVPVVVGAQVSKEGKGQGGEPGVWPGPELEHIREADDLANDAAGVLTLYRDFQAPEELKVKVVKNRDGVNGKNAVATFEGASGRILDLEELRYREGSSPAADF